MYSKVTSLFGYQQITDLSVSVGLTVPDKDLHGVAGTPRFCIIRTEAQSVRYRDDDFAPTATVGMPLLVADVLEYDGDLKRVKFIEQAAGAKLNIAYYS